MTESAISVIGIGKLGAPMAACLAAKGYSVIAADFDADKVAAINRAEAPVFEPGLPELIRENQERIRATQSVRAAVSESSLTFIVVPTPSDSQGEFSVRYVLSACEEIGQALRSKAEFHVVVLTSTVMPGAMDTEVRQTLEKASGKQCGQDFGLCYSPEFIALGSVIHDLFHPDFILIGESDARSGDILSQVYRRFCDSEPAIQRMNFVNAELTKIAINTYVTTKISYANMLSEICEYLPDADVDIVTTALGLDSRIGRKYLKGATGYGGPCFPRDNIAFAQLARRIGTRALLAEATHQINQDQSPRLAKIVRSHLQPGGTVGILGLSYKPDTDVITESQGVQLATDLAQSGVSVVVFDPAAMDNARVSLDGLAVLASTASECVEKSDMIVIATPWAEFRQVPIEAWKRQGQPRIVLDCWRILAAEPARNFVKYIALGTGPKP